jgi:hypothetical protein
MAEECRRHYFRTSKESKTARWRSHRDSRAIRRRPTSEIGLAWLTASNSRYCWIAGAGASCTGRGALAKHGPAGPTPSWSVTSPDRNQLFQLYGSAAIPRDHFPLAGRERTSVRPVPELVQSDADTPLARKTGSGVKAGGGTPTPPQRYRLNVSSNPAPFLSADPFADPHDVLLRLKSSGAVSSSRQRGDQKLISCC